MITIKKTDEEFINQEKKTKKQKNNNILLEKLKKGLKCLEELEQELNINIDDYLMGIKYVDDVIAQIKNYCDKKIKEKIYLQYNDFYSLYSYLSSDLCCKSKKEIINQINLNIIKSNTTKDGYR